MIGGVLGCFQHKISASLYDAGNPLLMGFRVGENTRDSKRSI